MILDFHFVKHFLLLCYVCQYPNLLPVQEQGRMKVDAVLRNEIFNLLRNKLCHGD